MVPLPEPANVVCAKINGGHAAALHFPEPSNVDPCRAGTHHSPRLQFESKFGHHNTPHNSPFNWMSSSSLMLCIAGAVCFPFLSEYCAVVRSRRCMETTTVAGNSGSLVVSLVICCTREMQGPGILCVSVNKMSTDTSIGHAAATNRCAPSTLDVGQFRAQLDQQIGPISGSSWPNRRS